MRSVGSGPSGLTQSTKWRRAATIAGIGSVKAPDIMCRTK
jgi:hypothetical protein